MAPALGVWGEGCAIGGNIVKIVYTKPTLTKAKVTLQAVTASDKTSIL